MATTGDKLATLDRVTDSAHREAITAALARHAGDVDVTAKALGMSRRNLYKRCHDLEIDPAQYRKSVDKPTE